MHEVTAVQTRDGCRLVLTFAGGEQREIELSGWLTFDGVFEALRDPAYFRQVTVNGELGTIAWPNGADLCPDVLYERSRPVPAGAGAAANKE